MNSKIVYWPTLLWGLGFLEYIAQVLAAPRLIQFLGMSVFVSVGILFFQTAKDFSAFKNACLDLRSEFVSSPFLFKPLVVIVIFLLMIAGLESRLPPRLIQESDALVYHMSLARQHLLIGSLSHITWSVADLWPMTIQWGFAPFWFMFTTINKIPQFIATLWVFFLALSLGRKNLKGFLGWLPALAFISTHGVMIQLGTAMMDLSILYFAVAFFHAIQLNRRGWAILHLGVFASAKSFSPPQILLLVLLVGLFYFIWKRQKFKIKFRNVAPVVLGGALICCILLSRSAYVGLKRAGTPLSPFFTCQIVEPPGCDGEPGQIIKDTAEQAISMKDFYGEGRGPIAFIKHLWTISVPSNGVNNAFDYPLGLAWLLWVIFFMAQLFPSLREDDFSVFFVVAVGFWILWWVGSQQARWLYPVILFGWLGSAQILKKVNSKLILGALCLSSLMSLISEFRVLHGDLFKSATSLQEVQEKKTDETRIDVLYLKTPLVDHVPGDRHWIIR